MSELINDIGEAIYKTLIYDNRYEYILEGLANTLIISFFAVLIGTLISFNTKGIDFALTALFLTVFIEQWMSTKNHLPAIIGVVCSIVCLLIFKSANFLIPSMILITVILLLTKEKKYE